MSRVLVAVALVALAVGCRSHPPAAVELTGETCIACHQDDYDRAPDHPGRYPQSCGECHRTDAWQPALGFGHPEAAFPVASGAHDGVACLDCHQLERGSSVDGANTDCIGCHTGDHVQAVVDGQHGGVPDYGFQPAVPNFCLTCHPDGQADNHPEAAFPIASGAHAKFSCGDCHNADLGASTDGQNADCIGCHTGEHSMAKMADKHSGEGDYQWQPDVPDFCRECHANGRN